MKFFSAQDILDYFPDIKVIGDVSKKFSNLKPIGRENKDSIIWVSDKYDLSEVIKKTKSNIIICKYNYAHFIIDKKKTFITTENPRLLFSKIIKKFFSVNIIPSIHNTAIIETDTIGKYNLDFINGKFLLKSTNTDCLAKGYCIVPDSDSKNNTVSSPANNTQNSCNPGGGCC